MNQPLSSPPTLSKRPDGIGLSANARLHQLSATLHGLGGSPPADVHQLRIDAEQRGWDSEVERHQRVIDNLEGHLRRLNTTSPSKAVS